MRTWALLAIVFAVTTVAQGAKAPSGCTRRFKAQTSKLLGLPRKDLKCSKTWQGAGGIIKRMCEDKQTNEEYELCCNRRNGVLNTCDVPQCTLQQGLPFSGNGMACDIVSSEAPPNMDNFRLCMTLSVTGGGIYFYMECPDYETVMLGGSVPNPQGDGAAGEFCWSTTGTYAHDSWTPSSVGDMTLDLSGFSACNDIAGEWYFTKNGPGSWTITDFSFTF
eukprot:m.54471 g.54471  ORF g.54471 m.54471 type:complete len:220 (+) comp11418_c0_seq2:167-826(+)